jgi:hypothetical protein
MFLWQREFLPVASVSLLHAWLSTLYINASQLCISYPQPHFYEGSLGRLTVPLKMREKRNEWQLANVQIFIESALRLKYWLAQFICFVIHLIFIILVMEAGNSQ